MVEISVCGIRLVIPQPAHSSAQAIYPTVVVILIANSVSQTDTIYRTHTKIQRAQDSRSQAVVLSALRFVPGSATNSNDVISVEVDVSTTHEDTYTKKGREHSDLRGEYI
jgi:hypothetical protein